MDEQPARRLRGEVSVLRSCDAAVASGMYFQPGVPLHETPHRASLYTNGMRLRPRAGAARGWATSWVDKTLDDLDPAA
jgi:hypothetical protein